MTKITNITILGGGTSGWMSATTLLSQFPDKKITLVESPNISTVGVGESTIPGMNNWLNFVGINYADFMPHCDATFKLSIAFKDWYRKDSGTFHTPFGPLNMAQYDFGPSGKQEHYDNFEVQLNHWHLKKIFYPETPVSEYAEWFYPSMALINQNKSFLMNREERPTTVGFTNMDHAYQFDATKFGLWLRDNYCKTRYSNNFTHILAEVKEIPLNDNGIEYLVLDNGQKLEADLFIDCTGFKSLLLTETFNVPFQNITNIIPNNYSWATKIPYKDPETQIVNYTNCTAIENGWIWEIPLWSRMGAGYVFSDKFISTDNAQKEFKQGLIKKGYTNVDDLEYKLIPMRCGVQSNLWVKNTCAIGLSAGFIEPLHSNGLHNTHQFLFNLCRTLARDYISEWDRKEYTTKCQDDFNGLVSIVALNYGLAHRDDTEYWRDLQNNTWADDLFHNTASGFSKYLSEAYYNKNFLQKFHPHSPDLLHMVAAGMNWNPMDKHSIKYYQPSYSNREYIEQVVNVNTILGVKSRMEERRMRWHEHVKDDPSPYQYLKDKFYMN